MQPLTPVLHRNLSEVDLADLVHLDQLLKLQHLLRVSTRYA